MGTDWNANPFEHRRVLRDGAVIHRHAGIVDDFVDDAVGIGLRHPAIVVDGFRPVFAAGRIDLVDGDDLARLRLLDHVVVVITPPGSRIAAEGLAAEVRIAGRTRAEIENAYLEDVARLGAADVDRTGEDMDAKALAGAASMDGSIHRSGAPAIDALVASSPS